MRSNSTRRTGFLLGTAIASALLIFSGTTSAQTAPAQPDTPTTDTPAIHTGPHKKKKDTTDPGATPNAPATPGAPGAAPGGKPGAPAAPTAPPAAPSGPGLTLPRGSGPWDNDLLIAVIPAKDPLAGPNMGSAPSVDTKVFDRGGVASLTRDSKGRLVGAYQWFPQMNAAAFDKVAIRTSNDEGKSWSGPKTVVFVGLPDGAMRPCDPTLVLLDDGRLRMYFTSHLRGDKAATFSAVSPANDGQTFTVEPGVRFSDDSQDVLDCAVAKLGDTWHYFAPIDGQNGSGRCMAFHATSKDGLTFDRQSEVTVDQPPSAKGPQKEMVRHHWLGCAASSDGKTLRFFGTLDGRGGIWSAHSSNGADWKLDEVPLKTGVDPAVVELKDGSLLVLATSPPRPGTPSAKNKGPGNHP